MGGGGKEKENAGKREGRKERGQREGRKERGARQGRGRVGNYLRSCTAAGKRTRVHRGSGIVTSMDPSSLEDRQGEASKMINGKGDASTGWLAPDYERDRDAGG